MIQVQLTCAQLNDGSYGVSVCSLWLGSYLPFGDPSDDLLLVGQATTFEWDDRPEVDP